MAPKEVRVFSSSSDDSWSIDYSEFEFELEPGTLLYRIKETDTIQPDDLVRADKRSYKWIKIKDRYTALVGRTIVDVEREFGARVVHEILREYLS